MDTSKDLSSVGLQREEEKCWPWALGAYDREREWEREGERGREGEEASHAAWSSDKVPPNRSEARVKMTPSTPSRSTHDMRLKVLSRELKGAPGLATSGGAGRRGRCIQRLGVEEHHQGRHHQCSRTECEGQRRENM